MEEAREECGGEEKRRRALYHAFRPLIRIQTLSDCGRSQERGGFLRQGQRRVHVRRTEPYAHGYNRQEHENLYRDNPKFAHNCLSF